MSIFRVQKNKNYSVISNTFIFDDKLSWKAKGILAYFLARPDEWEFYMSEIVKHAKDGKDSLSAGIKELEEAGYIDRKQKRTIGKFKGYEYEVFEEPQRIYRNGKTAAEKPISSNPPIVNTDCKESTNKKNSVSDIAKKLYEIYPVKNKGKQLTKKAEKVIKEHGYDILSKCIKLYSDKIKQQGTPEQYIKGFAPFLGETYFDYLDIVNGKEDNVETEEETKIQKLIRIANEQYNQQKQ